MKQKEKAGLFCSILGTALTSSGTVLEILHSEQVAYTLIGLGVLALIVGGFMLIFEE